MGMDELMRLLRGEEVPNWEPLAPAFIEEAALGKMFGVLVVQVPQSAAKASAQDADSRGTSLAYLAGYSGQLGGRSDWPGFVPAVVDYLQPDGYFKTHEGEISQINKIIEELTHGEHRQKIEAELDGLRQKSKEEIEAYRSTMRSSKQRRDALRLAARESGEPLEPALEAQLLKESQFQKAELRRLKKRWNERLDDAGEELRQIEDELSRLSRIRRQKSDDLQDWLFRQFSMLNAQGERRGLKEIFADYGAAHEQPGLVPPSGSGECCEPRLLQAAYERGLKPVAMAMFWWGDSPREEVRHQGQCYPACRSKCRPILSWMLQGLNVEPNALEQESHHDLEIVYEDDALSVVCKPAGMLSVPGKSVRESVESVMRERLHLPRGPIIVHRLDMDTSGLMVVAHTPEAYRNLQRQFLNHEVHKRYEALLEHPLTMKKGEISLPLGPDVADRPRQKVDFQKGKPALTRFESLGDCRVSLWPETGRTHQLRVHCAHREGLNDPIRGDELYGHRAERLYLHAAELTFLHPTTGQEMHFEAKAPF
jgi:tRNA pseudouridine32 synthase/23S rRNA pseudouridine746 synthase